MKSYGWSFCVLVFVALTMVLPPVLFSLLYLGASVNGQTPIADADTVGMFELINGVVLAFAGGFVFLAVLGTLAFMTCKGSMGHGKDTHWNLLDCVSATGNLYGFVAAIVGFVLAGYYGDLIWYSGVDWTGKAEADWLLALFWLRVVGGVVQVILFLVFTWILYMGYQTETMIADVPLLGSLEKRDAGDYGDGVAMLGGSAASTVPFVGGSARARMTAVAADGNAQTVHMGALSGVFGHGA
jgi:hypothetical protein